VLFSLFVSPRPIFCFCFLFLCLFVCFCCCCCFFRTSKGGGEAEAVKAYDVFLKNAVAPFASICDALSGLGDNMGRLITQAHEGVRDIIVLATRAKPPEDNDFTLALAPYVTKTQVAVKTIRDIRVVKEFDAHHKAITEMLACLSWILQKPPRGPLPAAYVKETLGSAEFWSNRIRKEYKNKDDRHIAFCDGIKNCILQLSEYIGIYHKAGLSWNTRGISIAEAAIRLSDTPADIVDPLKSPKGTKRHPTLGGALAGGNIAGVMTELSKRQTADGSSAATGLKKVRKTNGDDDVVEFHDKKGLILLFTFLFHFCFLSHEK
jgi:adenylyl cyclase-associated protein